MEPGDFPIGSPHSRAAARAMLIKQGEQENEFSADCIVNWGGLPVPKGEPIVATPPDTSACYTMPDGSFVRVTRRHWDDGERSGVTAFIHQTSPAGGAYNGSYEVHDLSDIKRCGCRCDEVTTKEKCRSITSEGNAREHA